MGFHVQGNVRYVFENRTSFFRHVFVIFLHLSDINLFYQNSYYSPSRDGYRVLFLRAASSTTLTLDAKLGRMMDAGVTLEQNAVINLQTLLCLGVGAAVSHTGVSCTRPWVGMGAFPWRVGGDKFYFLAFVQRAFCPCGLPLLQLWCRFNSGTLLWSGFFSPPVAQSRNFFCGWKTDFYSHIGILFIARAPCHFHNAVTTAWFHLRGLLVIRGGTHSPLNHGRTGGTAELDGLPRPTVSQIGNGISLRLNAGVWCSASVQYVQGKRSSQSLYEGWTQTIRTPFLHQTTRTPMLLDDWLNDWCALLATFFPSFLKNHCTCGV